MQFIVPSPDSVIQLVQMNKVKGDSCGSMFDAHACRPMALI